MLTERSIINFLIWLGGLIIGPYVATSAVIGNFVPLLAIIGICFLALMFGGLRDNMCFLPFLAVCISGKFTFLPLNLAPGEIASMALVFYYFIAYVALQRKIAKTGPLFLFLPIVIVAALVLYHEHSFGLRSMGGGREGARGALLILLGCVTYVCGVSVDSPSPKALIRIPICCLILTLISAIPYTLSTYWPQSAPFLILLTDSINASAFAADTLGSDQIVRNSGQSGVGIALATFLACFYPAQTWWRPHRWWVAIAVMGCFVLVLLGGFRSTLISFAILMFVATWCHSAWRTLMLVPVMVLAIFVIVAAHANHSIKLPESVQRTLSFLPGDWDPEAVASTDSSNEFREKIQNVYLREDVMNSPLIGNGFSYDSEDFARYNYLAKTQETPDGYYGTKIFVTGKVFHIGWISVYDGIGIIGTIAFVFFALSLIWMAGKRIFGREADRSSLLFPLQVWLFTNMVSGFIGFFLLYGDFKTAFPGLCYYAIIIAHLNRLEIFGFAARAPSRESYVELPQTKYTVPA